MHLLALVRRIVPASPRSIPIWLRWLAVPAVAVLVVLGIWLTGGVLTNDFELATLLTGAFLTAAGAAALVAALRWRALAAPVLGTYVVVAGSLGGYLLVTSTRDVVVNENVVAVATDPTPRPTSSSATSGEPAGLTTQPVALSRGAFTSGEHETTGTATVIRLPNGNRVLTLTDLATSPGPDLRVYLVPGDGTSVHGFLDLGQLKGNKGEQQYTIPDDARLTSYGAVVIWCRAFSVSFGHAVLS